MNKLKEIKKIKKKLQKVDVLICEFAENIENEMLSEDMYKLSSFYVAELQEKLSKLYQIEEDHGINYRDAK